MGLASILSSVKEQYNIIVGIIYSKIGNKIVLKPFSSYYKTTLQLVSLGTVCCLLGCSETNFTLVYPNTVKNGLVPAGCDYKINQDNALVCKSKEYKVTEICGGSPSLSTARLYSGNKHKLVVISLSDGLNKQSRVIQEGLNDVLLNLKPADLKTPFTLLALGGQQPFSLLSSKDLVAADKSNFIRTKIEMGMQFSAGNFSALDLDLLDNLIQERATTQDAVDSVLYVTDNRSLRDRPQEIPKSKLGVPFSWHKDGIHLLVLTTKPQGCDAWQYVEAQCVPWQGQDNDLRQMMRNTLNTFLTGQN